MTMYKQGLPWQPCFGNLGNVVLITLITLITLIVFNIFARLTLALGDVLQPDREDRAGRGR